MNFAAPNLRWLLLVFPPAMVVFFWWSGRVRQRLMRQFIQDRLLGGLTVGLSVARQRIGQGCLILAVVCGILALARPQWGFSWEETVQRGLDIVVAIDTSKSMLAEDIAPNRLTRAKLAALDLMQQAKSDRLGLIAFAGSAFLQCPLTIDDVAFRQSVESLNERIIPQGGTALAEAIETALTAFKETDNHKVLVLISDGEDHEQGVSEAAKKASEAGLRIFTIGVGSVEGELLRVRDQNGGTDFLLDENGNAVKSHLNPALLQEIATACQGFYLPLQGAKTMETLYERGLAPLPKSESKQRLVKQYQEKFYWFLVPAILLLLLEMLLPERPRERLASEGSAGPGSARVAAAVGLMVGLLVCPELAQGSASSALREYNAGNYDQALREYQKLVQSKADDPRLHFNAGTAAYRDQKLDEADKQFSQALTSLDLRLQELGYYNRGNTQFHLGERNPDPGKRSEAWEKALKDYESALKLNPQDGDAKHNLAYVKRRLEELKQQQQKSQQNKSDQQKNQDQQQQQQQEKQDPQKQDQQKQDQQQQNQSSQDQQKQQSAQNQEAGATNQPAPQPKPEESQDSSQQKAQAQAGNQQQDQQTNSASAQAQPGGEEKDEEGRAAAAGQMTREQAQQLLDAQKGEEKLLPVKPNNKPLDRSKRVKDW
jgi:Ca-activated chloride channel family protein